MLSILGSLFSGGTVGLLGWFVNNWFKGKEKANERAHELAKERLEQEGESKATDNAIREIEANIKVEQTITEREIAVAEVKRDGIEAVEQSKVIAEVNKDSITERMVLMLLNPTIPLIAWVTVPVGVVLITLLGFTDVIRKLIRPAVTVVSLFFAGFVLVHAYDLYVSVGGLDKLDDGQLLKLVIVPLIDLVVFICSSATTFWFSSRTSARDFNKRIDNLRK